MKCFLKRQVVGLAGGMLSIYIGLAVSHASIIEVGPGKPYSTINSAIAAATSGDTIRIADGVYNEDLIINKRLRLEAENVGGAIVDGGNRNTNHIIDVRAASDLFGLHIRNGHAAVNQHNVGVHYTCTRCIVTDTDIAFGVENSADMNGTAAILNSVVYNVYNAVTINDGGTITIENSIIANTAYAYGIQHGVAILPSHNTLFNVDHRASYGPTPPGTIGSDPNEMIGNPWFVNPAANDFRLFEGSPAIDSGKVVGLPYSGLAPDRGAYEGFVPVPEPAGILLCLSAFVAVFLHGRTQYYRAM